MAHVEDLDESAFNLLSGLVRIVKLEETDENCIQATLEDNAGHLINCFISPEQARTLQVPGMYKVELHLDQDDR
jgi:hypothetical protein